tara:strand:- start:494 stop:1447 length:954 start_codon:yes stop_codon:yes gene_type:complete
MRDTDLAVDSAVSKSLRGNANSMIDFKDGKFADKKDATILNEKYWPLFEVEMYVTEVAKKYDVELSFDVTAKEDLFFKTINYTTYAGFFILHPLCFEQSMRQMTDAYADNCKIKNDGHIGYVKKSINKNKNFSKYNFVQTKNEKPKDVLVVLTGGNKLKKHSCVGKLKSIIEKHGKENVLFKKHPISENDIYEELSEFLGGINYASGHSNLHDLMVSADHIYTTMMSESALIAYVLGKNVSHYDLWQNRDTTSFGHINHFLFSSSDPLLWANQCFASSKSGVIHPEIDDNWQKKVDEYFEYIMKLRSFFDGAYFMGG